MRGRSRLPARRSCLTVPGGSATMIGKAMSSTADQIMLDLEDAVAPQEKVRARETVAVALDAGGRAEQSSPQVRSVRINDVTTPWALDDLRSLIGSCGAQVDSVVLPKAEAVSHVHWLDHTMTMLEHDAGVITPIPVELQIEGPSGLSLIADLIEASPRVASVAFGPWDFLAALQMPEPSHTRVLGPERLDSILLAIVTACRRFGVQAMDGPYPSLADTDGLTEAAGRALDLGCDGKWAIHPAQLEPINAVFTPSEAALASARAAISAYEHALAAGRGAISVQGALVDEASRRLALATIERGRAAGLSSPEFASSPGHASPHS